MEGGGEKIRKGQPAKFLQASELKKTHRRRSVGIDSE